VLFRFGRDNEASTILPAIVVALLGHATIAFEQPAPQSIILASTTSVENSGLLAHILPAFTKGDPRLLNRYDVILLNPAKHPVPKQALAARFAQWLVSPEGQAAIGAYKVHGEQLFYPSAAAPR
jgi:ABC-type tungstate transport system permease subunit